MEEIGQMILDEALEFLAGKAKEYALQHLRNIAESIFGADLADALFGKKDTTFHDIQKMLNDIKNICNNIFDTVNFIADAQHNQSRAKFNEFRLSLEEQSQTAAGVINNAKKQKDAAELKIQIDQILDNINPAKLPPNGLIESARKFWLVTYGSIFPYPLQSVDSIEPNASDIACLLTQFSDYLLANGEPRHFSEYLPWLLKVTQLAASTFSTFAHIMEDTHDVIMKLGTNEQKKRLESFGFNHVFFEGVKFGGKLSGRCLKEVLNLWPGLDVLYVVCYLQIGDFVASLLSPVDYRLLENHYGRNPINPQQPIYHCEKPLSADYNRSSERGGIPNQNSSFFRFLPPMQNYGIDYKFMPVMLEPLSQPGYVVMLAERAWGPQAMFRTDEVFFCQNKPDDFFSWLLFSRVQVHWYIKLRKIGSVVYLFLQNMRNDRVLEINIDHGSSSSQQIFANNQLFPNSNNQQQNQRWMLTIKH